PGAEPAQPSLRVPAAERGLGGGEPTEAEAEAEAAPPKPQPTLLIRALGLEDSPVKIYGWIQNSFTGNTNGRPKSGENFGVWPNHRANQWLGNQYYLVIENPVELNDTFNLGFRVDNLFGNDWQWNKSYGLFDRAWPLNWFAGYDLAQIYGEAHLPILTPGGLDIKGGRWYTLAGYEQVPAISRPLLSVPYMFNFGQPFTHVGVVTTLHLTSRINLYNGAINGWDRWINIRYTWGYIGGFSWTSKDEKTSLAFIAIWGPNQFPYFPTPAKTPIFPTGVLSPPLRFAGRQNPTYYGDDRVLFTTVLTRKWTDRLTQVIETDQAQEHIVPFANTVLPRNQPLNHAAWYSFGNWFLYRFTKDDKLTGVWRSEIFRDNNGVRTGFATNFSEFTLGLIYKPRSALWIRPEARYDFARSGHPYNDGTRNSQFTLAFDVILLY
ncbi:MAG: outer membrane beta-barrel protein, partial [Isosphaeraceae bacterium]|nr:outer membrane beta-barrel protein [Isosphaeraceae bacterium]